MRFESSWAIPVCVLLSTGLFGSAAIADPIYDAAGITAPFVTGSTPVSTSYEGGLNTGGSFRERAEAGLQLAVSARVSKDPGPTASARALATADATFVDIVVDGPAPETTVALSLPFNAFLTFDTASWSSALAGTSISSHYVDLEVLGSFGTGRYNVSWSTAAVGDPTTITENATAQIVPIFHRTSLLSSPPSWQPADAGIESTDYYRVSGTIDLPPTTVPTGIPLLLMLTVEVISDGTGSPLAGALSGSSIYGFGPRIGAPVFDLEPGFTVQSVDMGIVDNVIAAPEPSLPVLAAFGSLGVVALGAPRRAGERSSSPE